MSWISFHIHHKLSFEKLLISHILPLTHYLKDERLIKSMFYIRYWEGGPHIRYRVFKNENISTTKLKEIILSESLYFFNQAEADEEDFDLFFLDYKREIKRYGGIAGVEFAEKNFQDSSESILNLLNKKRDIWDYGLALAFSIQLNLTIIKEFTEDKKESVIFFKSNFKNWLIYSLKLDKINSNDTEEINKVLKFFNNSYDNQSDKINYIVKTIWEEKENDDWLSHWKKCCAEQKSMFHSYKDKINFDLLSSNSLDKKSEIDENSFFLLLNNLTHMSNNRIGIHLRDEAFISYSIMKALNSF